MATFIMQTRLTPQANQSPRAIMRVSHELMDRIRAECPKVKWKASYAVLGPADFIDIFQAPDVATATKVAAIIRSCGQATTEIWAATEWEEFTALMKDMPEAEELEPATSAKAPKEMAAWRERHPRRNGEKATPARKRM